MTALVALTVVVSSFAEGKKTVCIGTFSSGSNVNSSDVTALRNSILTGLDATGRLELTDINALNVGKSQEAQINAASEAGCTYLLNGTVNTVTETNKKNNDKTQYSCSISYTLQVTEVGTQKIFSTDTFTASWSTGETKSEAMAKAINAASSAMKRYVNNTFKTLAAIKSLEDVDKKKGAKTAYVGVGSGAGIQKGQRFDIFKEIDVAGSKGRKLIGAAKAQEVVGEDLTLVSITKGGKEIQEAFEQGATLIVETRATITLFDKL